MVTPAMAREPPSESPRAASWRDRAWLLGSALAPALLAARHVASYAGDGQDARIVRTVGLGYAGGFRALDTWLAAVFAAVPLGTRALRAELSGIFLLAATAALVFAIVRRTVVAVTASPAWSSIVAALASASVSLSYPFQREATAAGSSLAGVVLVLLALLLATEASPSWPLVAGLVALSLSYEPTVGICAAAIVIAALVANVSGARESSPDACSPSPPSPPSPPSRLNVVASVVLAFACGLVPFLLAMIRSRVSPISTSARLFALRAAVAPHIGATGSGPRHAFALLEGEFGGILLMLAAGGFVWGLLYKRARPWSVPLAALTTVACLGLAIEKGASPDAWNAVGLLAIVGVVACAAIAMQEGVLRVARAKLPLASASAAMIVVLEAAFPAILLDEGLTRVSARPTHATSTWEDTAFAGLPSGSLLLVSAPRLYARLLAAKASGELPADFTVIPTFDPSNEASASALIRDPRLVPLFRDMALSGIPEELSLSTLATARPLAMATDPRWDRNLTRHLIPTGLLAAFEPEPRGGTDRKRALEAFEPSRMRLEKDLGTPLEPALGSLTASILLDRAVSAARTGEQEVALRALDDAAAFAPNDARVSRLKQKEMSAHGPVDVHDLVGEGLAGEAP